MNKFKKRYWILEEGLLMLSQYLAQYLLNTGLLSPQQVREILENEQEHRVKLGVIAINKGVMNAEQVETVHQLQVRADKRFGEIAIEEGFITEKQLEELLAVQADGNLNFGQAIIDRGFMTLSQLEAALERYNKNNAFAVIKALDKIEIKKIDFSELEEVREIYGEYVDLFVRSLLRFINTTSLILQGEPVDVKNKYLMSQQMTGESAFATGLLLSEDTLIEIARRYSGEEINCVDELAVDSVAEFLNVTNGLYIVNLSNRGIDVDLEPQKTGRGIVPIGTKQAVVNIDTNFGRIQLILSADDLQ